VPTQALSKSRMVVPVGNAGPAWHPTEGCVPAHAITTLHYLLVSKYQSKDAAATLIIRHP